MTRWLAALLLLGAACAAGQPVPLVARVDVTIPPAARVVPGEPPEPWVIVWDTSGRVTIEGRVWSIDVGYDVVLHLRDVDGDPGFEDGTAVYSGMGFEERERSEPLGASDVRIANWKPELVSGTVLVSDRLLEFHAPADASTPREAGAGTFRIEVGETISTSGSGLGIISWLTLDAIDASCEGCPPDSASWTATRTNQRLIASAPVIDGAGRLPWATSDGTAFCFELDGATMTVARCS